MQNSMRKTMTLLVVFNPIIPIQSDVTCIRSFFYGNKDGGYIHERERERSDETLKKKEGGIEKEKKIWSEWRLYYSLL